MNRAKFLTATAAISVLVIAGGNAYAEGVKSQNKNVDTTAKSINVSKQKGTFIRGADGEIYYVSGDKLQVVKANKSKLSTVGQKINVPKGTTKLSLETVRQFDASASTTIVGLTELN